MSYVAPPQTFAVFTTACIDTVSGVFPETGVTLNNPPVEGAADDATPGAPVHCFAIAAIVRGPTAPKPVLAGAPDVTILNFVCHRFTDASVSGPYEPVTWASGYTPGSCAKNCWRRFTSSPLEPRFKFLVRLGHARVLEADSAILIIPRRTASPARRAIAPRRNRTDMHILLHAREMAQ